MLVLTLHIVFPVIIQLGLDPIWFGVVVVIVLEMGLISPPVGVNVFVVNSIAKDVPMGTILETFGHSGWQWAFASLSSLHSRKSHCFYSIPCLALRRESIED